MEGAFCVYNEFPIIEEYLNNYLSWLYMIPYKNSTIVLLLKLKYFFLSILNVEIIEFLTFPLSCVV